jgi:hypothetical protein
VSAPDIGYHGGLASDLPLCGVHATAPVHVPVHPFVTVRKPVRRRGHDAVDQARAARGAHGGRPTLPRSVC